MSTWYWKNAQHQEPQGPISAHELKHLALSNRLHRTDLVWKQGMQEWVQANRLRGLFEGTDAQQAQMPSDGGPGSTSQQEAKSTVYHSTSMYQKSGPHTNSSYSTTASGFGSSRSYGGQTMNDPSAGLDYEMLPTFFSFRGRMRRTTYFLYSMGIAIGFVVLLLFIVLIAGGVEVIDSLSIMAIITFFSVGATVILSFPFVKRLHDLNLSAWFYWINFIPYVNILFSLYVLFARGTQGPNKYGPDPRM